MPVVMTGGTTGGRDAMRAFAASTALYASPSSLFAEASFLVASVASLMGFVVPFSMSAALAAAPAGDLSAVLAADAQARAFAERQVS